MFYAALIVKANSNQLVLSTELIRYNLFFWPLSRDSSADVSDVSPSSERFVLFSVVIY